MVTGPVVSGGRGGQVLMKRSGSNMTDWVDMPETLAEDRTFYVSPTGSDSNDGSASGAAFGTIQAAIDAVAGLDLGSHNVTIQLANGTYTVAPEANELGLVFRDPVGGLETAPYMNFGFDPTYPCTLRGDPVTPSNVVINGGVGNRACLSFFNSVKWKVVGVKLTTPTEFGTLVSAIRGRTQLNSIDFNVSAGTTNLISSSMGSYIETGPYDEVNNCRITGSGTGGNALYAGYNSVIISSTAIDCTSAAIAFATFTYVESNSYCIDYNSYTNKASITGPRFHVRDNSALVVRTMDNTPGSTTGTCNADSSVFFNNILGSFTGEHLTVLAPTGRNLDTRGYENCGKTFSNQGATSIAIFTLPPNGAGIGASSVMPYVVSFVVQDVDGIRITAPAGCTIRFGATVTAAAGSIQSTTIGSAITLRMINLTEWVATSVVGTWT